MTTLVQEHSQSVSSIDTKGRQQYIVGVPTAEEVYAQLGERIAERRKARGLTQQDVAAAIGLSRTSVTNIESGRQPVQVYTLLLLAKVLKTSVASLLPTSGEVTLPDDLDASAREWLAAILKDESR